MLQQNMKVAAHGISYSADMSVFCRIYRYIKDNAISITIRLNNTVHFFLSYFNFAPHCDMNITHQYDTSADVTLSCPQPYSMSLSHVDSSYISLLLPRLPKLLRQCSSNGLGNFGNLSSNKEMQPQGGGSHSSKHMEVGGCSVICIKPTSGKPIITPLLWCSIYLLMFTTGNKYTRCMNAQACTSAYGLKNAAFRGWHTTTLPWKQ